MGTHTVEEARDDANESELNEAPEDAPTEDAASTDNFL
jgi:hypothetical protein